MKMAKASEADLAMAMKLANYLDAIERGQMPDELSADSESIEWLDSRDQDQTEKLIDGLRRLLNQGSISRVIYGMAVICDPANKCIDPDADTIEHHPELVKAAEQRDELQMRYDAAHSELARMTDQLGECRNVANDLRQQRDDLLALVKGFHRKLETYRNVYSGDKELRRLLTECEAAIAKVKS